MRTDVKIGIAVGILVVLVAIIWLGNHDSSKPEESTFTPPEPEPTKSTEAEPPVESTVDVKVVEKEIPPPPEMPETPEQTPETPIEEPKTTLVEEAAEPDLNVPEERKPRYYTVVDGDTLSTISESYYGHSKHWKVIQDANKDLVKNSNYLAVGWRLQIPYPDEVAPTKVDVR